LPACRRHLGGDEPLSVEQHRVRERAAHVDPQDRHGRESMIGRVCDTGALPALEHDEYLLDTTQVRQFVAEVRARIAASGSPAEAVAVVGPLFAGLIADRDWLPAEFQHDAPESGMGGGIGQWLLFRAADRSLCLFSLVVPPGSRTPVHDHLAWGLVGLYRRNQDEEFYRPRHGRLELLRRRPLQPRDSHALLPPTDDIHCVGPTAL